MAILVQKYGGTSVADPDRLLRVAERVAAARASGRDVVVVVSAMAGKTDELLELAQRISKNPDRRELDMLLSVGERISMSLLAMAIKDLGHDAVSFTGSQCGIITNDAHTGARILEVRPYRVEDELARGRVVIVAGYQGVSYRKEVTTLGRGGSDTTAVALAAALGAEACEIYSDVEGIFTSDPRVVEDARLLDEISYEDMQELARCGARVLNEQAVEFARRAGIALYARSTFEEGSGRGTLVRRNMPESGPEIVAVTSRKDLRMILASGDATPGRLLTSLPGADGPVTVVAPGTRPSDQGRPLGSVSLIGEGAGEELGLVGAFRDLLLARGIPSVGWLAASRSVTVFVELDQVDDLVRCCHERWIHGR